MGPEYVGQIQGSGVVGSGRGMVGRGRGGVYYSTLPAVSLSASLSPHLFLSSSSWLPLVCSPHSTPYCSEYDALDDRLLAIKSCPHTNSRGNSSTPDFSTRPHSVFHPTASFICPPDPVLAGCSQQVHFILILQKNGQKAVGSNPDEARVTSSDKTCLHQMKIVKQQAVSSDGRR